MAAAPQGTVTLLFTDVEGSTKLLERTGEGYAQLLAVHDRLLRAAFRRHGGFEVDTAGDAFFVAFGSASEAVAAASEAQRALFAHDWPAGQQVRVRMGLHTGEPRLIEDNYVGLDVHRAARVAAAGHGGQVLVSQSTRDLIDEQFDLRDLGEHRLKDLSSPQRLYELRLEGLPSEFPPLQTLEGRPTNLPVQPTPLIGRESELEQVAARLTRDDVRLLTLTGPGGTGKTRLALQAAADLLGDYTDGVYFVSLATVHDHELVMPTVAQTLTLREKPGETSLSAVSSQLREKSMLLVLDNLEQITEAGADIAELLAAASGLKVLATSRAPLRLSGEHVFPVPPLTMPSLDGLSDPDTLSQYEAVRLFVARAQAIEPQFAITDENAAAIAEICVRVDGLPLAIELAAARVRVLSPQAMLPRLDRRLALLTSGSRDQVGRQQTLRATIEWSYDLLSRPEQLQFGRLGVFAGGCRIDAAETVCDPDGNLGIDMLDGVASLVANSLLRKRDDPDDEPRFWMLETIREYALESLQPPSAITALRDRHAEHFLGLAERTDLASRTAEQSGLFDRLDADAANLRAAIEWTRTTGQTSLTVRFAAALWSYWCARGYLTEGRDRLEEAVGLTPEPPAQVLLGLCAVRHLGGGLSHRQLLEDAKHVLAACEQLGDEFLLAQAWNLVGRVQGSGLGEQALAEHSYTQALTFAERGNYQAEKAESMGWLMIMANFGPAPVEEGISRCEEFLEKAGGDLKARAFCLASRAPLEAMRGEFERARGLLSEGTHAFKALGLNVWAANNAQEGFYVEMLAGNPGGAATMLRSSYDALEAMGEHGFLSSIAGFLAQALYELEEYEEAEHFTRRCEEFAADDDVLSQVLWRSARAKTTARRGEAGRAEELAREAVELITQTEMINTHADALIDLAEVLELNGHWAEAYACSSEAGQLYARKGNTVSLRRAAERAAALEAKRS